MRKAFSVLADIILVFCVLLLLAVFLAPPLFGYSLDTILSGSMEPAIKTGAMIVRARAAPEEIKLGEVIAFNVEGLDHPVCHRVIEIIKTEEQISFRTKGDANESPDEWVVDADHLIGKIVFNLSWVGSITQFVKKPYGFALVVGLPAAIAIALEIKKNLKPKPNRRRRSRLIERPSPGSAWLCLLIGLVLIGVLGGMMAQNTQEKTLGSFAKESEETKQPLYVSERNMQNKGKLPLAICLFSEDKTVSFGESYFILSPGKQKEIKITGDSAEATIITGAFLPVLPGKTLYGIFIWNTKLAPFIIAGVWILPMAIIVFLILLKLNAKLEITKRKELMKRRIG